MAGIDTDIELIEQARAQAEAKGVGNASFIIMDPFQPLKFAESTFDLVNARFLVGQLPVSAWPQVITEFVRVTRPGGFRAAKIVYTLKFTFRVSFSRLKSS